MRNDGISNVLHDAELQKTSVKEAELVYYLWQAMKHF